MKVLRKHIAPLRAGIVLAALDGRMGPLLVLLFLPLGRFAPHAQGGASLPSMFAGMGALLLPVCSACFGLLSGVIGTFICNLLAGPTGGLEFSFAVQDAPS